MRFSPGCSCCGGTVETGCCPGVDVPTTLFATLTFDAQAEDGVCVCWTANEVKSVTLTYDPAQQAWVYTETCSGTRVMGVFLYCQTAETPDAWHLRVAIYDSATYPTPDVGSTIISKVSGWDAASGTEACLSVRECDPFELSWTGAIGGPCGTMSQAGWGCTYANQYLTAVITE